MRKSELDEMQVQRRNKIGNQSFMLLFYLLMLDIGSNGFGFKWINYPTNVFIIMLLCMTYYLIRLIMNSAYAGPQNDNKPIRKGVAVASVIAMCIAIAAIVFRKYIIKTQTVDTNDNGALILFIIGIVSLVIISIVSIVAKKQNSEGDE